MNRQQEKFLNKYAFLTMEERIDRIGAILARAIRLILKKGAGNQKDLNIRKHLYPHQGG